MTISRLVVASLALGLACTSAIAAIPELSGIFVLGGKQQFMLVDPETKATSGWIGIGGEFEGYTLASFNAAKDTVILKRGDVEIGVPLRAATIKDASIAFSGKIQIGAAGSVDLQKATLVFGEERTFPLADGVTLTLKATQRNDGTIRYSSRFERVGSDGKKEILSAPSVIALPGAPFSVQAGEFGYTLQP